MRLHLLAQLVAVSVISLVAAATDATPQTDHMEQLLHQHRKLKQLKPAEVFAVNHDAHIQNARLFAGASGAQPSTARPTAAPGDIVAVGLDSTKSGVSLVLLDGKTLTLKSLLHPYLSGVCSAINTATLAVSPQNPSVLIVACRPVPPPASPTSTSSLSSSSSNASSSSSSRSSASSAASSSSCQLVMFDLDSQSALPLASIPAGYEPGSAVFGSDGSLYIQATKVLSGDPPRIAAAAATPSHPSGLSGKAEASRTTSAISLSVMFKFDTNLKLAAQYDLPLTQGAVAGLDITSGGSSTLLYTHFSPAVDTFHLTNQTTGEPLDFGAIPTLAASSCTSVAALYDGTALVGCTSSLTDPVPSFCAYLINRTAGVAATADVIRGPFCAPAVPPTRQPAAAASPSEDVPLNPGWVNIAVDAERQHFHMSVIDGVSAGGGDVGVNLPNLYKVRLSDFEQVQSAFVPANMVSMAVVGAAPASQQRCAVGFGQCCSPAGLPLRRKTPCQQPTDPCTMAATCNGRSITCPAPTPVPDGTVCSLNPPGLTSRKSILDPMPHLYPSRAVAAVQAATKATAAAQGLEHQECHKCYQGKCTRIFVLNQGQKTGQALEIAPEIVKARRGRAGGKPPGGLPLDKTQRSGSAKTSSTGVGRGLQGYSRIEQPAWMYCK